LIANIFNYMFYKHYVFLFFIFMSFDVSAQTAHGNATKKIVFLGDSLTAGYGLEIENSFPSLIQKRIEDLSLPYAVVNSGISGDTTAGGLSRINWILKQDLSILVIALGANDALRGFSPEVTKKNISLIIERVREKNQNIKILLIGMYAPPNLGLEYGEKFKQIFIDLSKDRKINFIPFLLEGVAGQEQLNLADGLHPNAEGYKVIAKKVWQKLETLL
jgi:acyl-CoA thioesterase-1